MPTSGFTTTRFDPVSMDCAAPTLPKDLLHPTHLSIYVVDCDVKHLLGHRHPAWNRSAAGVLRLLPAVAHATVVEWLDLEHSDRGASSVVTAAADLPKGVNLCLAIA